MFIFSDDALQYEIYENFPAIRQLVSFKYLNILLLQMMKFSHVTKMAVIERKMIVPHKRGVRGTSGGGAGLGETGGMIVAETIEEVSIN